MNVHDYDLITPLHIASEYGREEIVKLLVESGADVNAQDREGINSICYTRLLDNDKHGNKYKTVIG